MHLGHTRTVPIWIFSTRVTQRVFNEISNGIQFALYETPVSKAHVVDEGKPTNSWLILIRSAKRACRELDLQSGVTKGRRLCFAYCSLEQEITRFYLFVKLTDATDRAKQVLYLYLMKGDWFPTRKSLVITYSNQQAARL